MWHKLNGTHKMKVQVQVNAFVFMTLTFGTGVLHLIQINHQTDATIFCGRAGRPARPRTQHDYHHDTKVKPEAATAVIEFLMMGGKTPETC